MRKGIVLLMALIVSAGIFAQKYEVTPRGLRDANDLEKDYLVLEFEGKAASELFEKSIAYVNEKRADAESSIKGQTDGEYLRFATYVPIILRYKQGLISFETDGRYDTELRFKDGRVRYEIVNLRMKTEKHDVLFSGSKWHSYPIFLENGKIYRENAKVSVEKHFNAGLKTYIEFIGGAQEAEVEEW